MNRYRLYQIKDKLLYKGLFSDLFLRPNKPDFLIVGAQKAGTKALKSYLLNDNRMYCPPKEVGYFSTRNYEKGDRWYHNQIKSNSGKLFFEKTPEYLYHPEAIAHIHDYDPNMKMIAVLRNPIDRAFSSWLHPKRYHENANAKRVLLDRKIAELGRDKAKYFIDYFSGNEYPSFSDSISLEIEWIQKGIFVYMPAFIRMGMYFEQVKRFFDVIGRDNLLILDSSELRTQKIDCLRKVYKFLSIDEPEFSDFDLSDQHKSNYKKLEMSSDDRNRLKSFYEPHNQKLFELIGNQFDWQ